MASSRGKMTGSRLRGLTDGIVSGQRAGDDRLGVANQQPRLFASAEQVIHTIYLQRVVARRHREVAHGVALAAGIGILIARILKAGHLVQLEQVEERRHQLGMTGVEQDDIFQKFRQCILLAGFHV